MANTPDPRDFYRVSRVVLMPSSGENRWAGWRSEAMANGIPVLASDRGALPETLGDAGFVFTIPERITPASRRSRPREVAPGWPRSSGSGTTRRSKARHRGLAKAEARRWDGDRLAEQYEAFFRSFGQSG